MRTFLKQRKSYCGSGTETCPLALAACTIQLGGEYSDGRILNTPDKPFVGL